MAHHLKEVFDYVEPPSTTEDTEVPERGEVMALLQGSNQWEAVLEQPCYLVGRLGMDLEGQDGSNV